MAVGMPEDVTRMVRSIPADQRLELDALFGSPRGQISIFEFRLPTWRERSLPAITARPPWPSGT